MIVDHIASPAAVLITGASSGIGKACALRLDRLGFRVFAGVLAKVDGDALQQTTSDRLTLVPIDVTDAAAIASAVDKVAAAVGEAGLAGLVNNAGTAVMVPLEFLPIDELRRQLEVNVTGQIAVTQAFLPLLRKGNGRIVNVGSMAGRVALPFLGPYCASKFALEALTDTLRMELRPWGISVSIVEPGRVMTPMWQATRAAMDKLVRSLPSQVRTLYGLAIATMHEVVDKEGAAGIPADVVAEAIVHALVARRPKTRYVVGWDARLQGVLARYVPDRIRDRLILRRMRLLHSASFSSSVRLFGLIKPP